MNNHVPPVVRRPTQRKRNSGWGILLLILFTLGLIAGARWFVQQGIALAPTPTVTATRKTATDVPTADFRATRNAQELATQQARALAMAGIDTPTPLPTETPTPTPTHTPTLAVVDGTQPTPELTVVVIIPGVLNQQTHTPTATPVEPTVEDPNVPPITTDQPTEETATATVPESVSDTPTEIPTEIPTETPTETPLATPTPTATLQPVISLQAFTQQTVGIYEGPSTRYTRTTEIAANQRVVMQGRNATGEWIYLCCEFNLQGWTRQRGLAVRENQLPPNAPTGANPNDVRWLVERQPLAIPATPIPMQTPIPNADYPLFRRDPAAQAYVPQAILPNWSRQWDSPQVIQAFSSPAIVVQQSVIIANEDNHIYAFDRRQGNQRWRYDIGQVVTVGPAAQVTDGNLDIYVVDRNGRVIALREQGNSASQLWAVSLNVAPKTAINVAGDLVFVTGQNNHVYAINRFTSALIWEITTTGNVLQYPTAGDQLLYVANQRLTAVDIFNRETIWQSDATLFSEVSAPPVYAYPGAIAMSEVYVSDSNGTVYAFDAANGALLWSYATGQRIDMMAVDRVRLYTVSGQIARAVNRSTGTEVWRQDIGGLIVGGPIVGDGQVLFVTTGGALFIHQGLNGERIAGTSTGATSVVAQPAIGDGQIFIPATNGIIHTLSEER
ncbi:PQQ-binding-like beta-propeller repeat protein [bacterium]|nr:PQQ-binding-like beta-propeller repeat protein [bacterium]